MSAKTTAIMSSTVIEVSNETENSISRTTADGRHLTYELKVIQQPERARACGSGAKCITTSSLLHGSEWVLTGVQLPQTDARSIRLQWSS